jgi:GNAT superfamily N-acetyltransferase
MQGLTFQTLDISEPGIPMLDIFANVNNRCIGWSQLEKIQDFPDFYDLMDSEEYSQEVWATNLWYLNNIKVVPKHRKAGIARKLLSHALQQAKDVGCEQLFLQAYPLEDSISESLLIAFYHSIGFRSLNLKYELPCQSNYMVIDLKKL